MIVQMKQTAAQVGVNMEYGGKVGNTRNAHRLIALADHDPKLQDTVVETLFKAYFEANDDVSSIETLSDIAASIDLFKTRDEARDFLQGEKGATTVDSEVENAYGMNITGVPHFIIDGKYSIGGAQEAPVFKHVFDLILKDGQEANKEASVPDGQTC